MRRGDRRYRALLGTLVAAVAGCAAPVPDSLVLLPGTPREVTDRCARLLEDRGWVLRQASPVATLVTWPRDLTAAGSTSTRRVFITVDVQESADPEHCLVRIQSIEFVPHDSTPPALNYVRVIDPVGAEEEAQVREALRRPLASQ